jgi:hypothetical protein
MPEHIRKTVVWSLWFLTWIGLLAGLFDRTFYEVVVAFSMAHAFLILVLHRFRVAAFPVQVRIGYVLWVAIGTYMPYMTVLMYITTLGLIGNLFFRYCPLARMLYFLPWNREENLSFGLVASVFLSPPVDGRFRPVPPAA